MDVNAFKPEKDIADVTGKTIFITGGTGGLGKESVIHLAKRNADRIYFTGRNKAAADKLIEETKQTSPGTELTFIECDFQSLDSVHEATKQFDSDRLDVLMCNAGIMATDPALSKDGYEIQFAINHMAHSVIIQQLLPVLQKSSTPDSPARIVILTSLGYKLPPSKGIVFDNLKTTQDYGFAASWRRYGQSKLANVLYAKELARRYPELLVVSVHPGVVNTDIVDGLSFFKRAFVHVTTIGSMIEREQGAYNQCYLSTVDHTKLKSGTFYEPIGKLGGLDKNAKNEELANKLWDWTQGEISRFL